MLATFQFQYGTIKSGSLKLDMSNINRFQFQYGTIKSVILQLDLLTGLGNFNSNMVQLKESVQKYKKRSLSISIPIWYN